MDENPTLPVGFDADWLNNLCNVLGLDAGTNDPVLVLQTATDMASEGPNADADDSPQEDDAPDPTPSAVAASAQRLGMELVDSDVLASLRAEAADGRKRVAAAERRDRELAVDSAIQTGKITPSRRDHWLKLIAADPGMADVLASTPPGMAVPLAESGHNHGESELSAPQPMWFR